MAASESEADSDTDKAMAMAAMSHAFNRTIGLVSARDVNNEGIDDRR